MRQVNYNLPGDDKEFFRCIQFVLEQECRKKKDGTLDDGYVNDPNDPGGETKYGISKRAYPQLNIKDLTLEDALSLYHRDYWKVAKAHTFPMNVCILDCSVNQGTKRAIRFLIEAKEDWKAYIKAREQHYIALYDGVFKNNPDRNKWKRIWFKRLNNLKKFIEVGLQK